MGEGRDPQQWRWPAGVEVPAVRGWPVSLRAGALVLRPLYRGDEAAWQAVRARNQTWLSPWDPTCPPEDQPWHQTVAEMRRQQWRQAKAGVALPWVMAWDPSWPDARTAVRRTRVIGSVGVFGITYGAARSASFGYWIDRDHAGRGLTPLGVALAMDYCLAVLRLHRLQVDVRPENAASLRVVAKLGLRAEGTKPRFLHIAGAWADHLAFALDASEIDGPLTARVLAGRPVPRQD